MNKVYHHNRIDGGRETTIVIEDGYAYVMIAIANESPDIAGIHDMVVHKSRRGEGLGRVLLEEAVEEAERQGADKVVLQTKRGGWLQEWYGRHDFSVNGELSRLTDPDGENVVMERTL